MRSFASITKTTLERVAKASNVEECEASELAGVETQRQRMRAREVVLVSMSSLKFTALLVFVYPEKTEAATEEQSVDKDRNQELSNMIVGRIRSEIAPVHRWTGQAPPIELKVSDIGYQIDKLVPQHRFLLRGNRPEGEIYVFGALFFTDSSVAPFLMGGVERFTIATDEEAGAASEEGGIELL
jgi:hypothetical protein